MIQMAGKTSMQAEKVHDRQAQDLLRNAEVAPVVVDDPFDSLAKIAVVRSTRDDPLARMHVRGQVDDAQFAGGRAYQRDWEAAERGPRAIDPTKEAVDGGRMPEPITDHQRKAAKKINEVRADLGNDGFSLTHSFLIERKTITQIAALRGFTGKSWEEYFGRRLRGCLERLAIVYGYAQPRPRY